MLTEQLLKLGFTKNEANIYVTLITHGQMQAGEISKKTLIDRRTTYDTLERLVGKGYISYSIISNKKQFNANNPRLIMEKIKEMEKEAESLSPQLLKLYKSSKEDQEANIYKGRKGIRSILQDMLTVKEYVGFGSNEKFPEIMQHDFDLFQKKKKELKIKSRTLMNSSMKGKQILKTGFTKYRFIKEKKAQPSSTFVYGKKVAIVIWSEIPVGIVIENETLAKTYLDYFDSLWSIAED